MNLRLCAALGPYDHVRDLRPQGIELLLLELSIEEIFFRFTKFREWQVSEMSFGKVISLMAEEPARNRSPCRSSCRACSAIPRSTSSESSGIRTPKDLEGKRVGIPEWAQTAGIYVRGLLQHEYGVDLASIDWRQAGVREPGRVEKIELRLPAGVRVQPMPEHTLAGMLAAGEIDAAISARDPGGKRLFADHRELEAAYFRKTGIFPIMHVVVLQARRVRARPLDRDEPVQGVRGSQAAQHGAAGGRRRLAGAGGVDRRPCAAMAGDCRRRLLALRSRGEPAHPGSLRPVRLEQGVSTRRLKVEELFAPETLERAKI